MGIFAVLLLVIVATIDHEASPVSCYEVPAVVAGDGSLLCRGTHTRIYGGATATKIGMDKLRDVCCPY